MSEHDYTGGAGYARKQPALDLAARELDRRDDEWRREVRPMVAYGRAIDAQDLAELLDSGNETNRARVFRDRLCTWAALQLPRAILLEERELAELERHRVNYQHHRIGPDGRPLPFMAPISEWGAPDGL